MTDLSAGFGPLDHSQFIKLLEVEYGDRDKAFEWFASYLSDRYFCVRVGDGKSDPCRLYCGVLQGSALYPVIVNLYTRPVGRIIQEARWSYHKYADNVQLYGDFDPMSCDDCLRITCQIQSCLNKVRTWMLRNMLKICDAKTELAIFVNAYSSPRFCLGDRSSLSPWAALPLLRRLLCAILGS